MPVTKKQVKMGQRKHAKRRARERYGVNLNRIDIIRIIETISSEGQDAVFLLRGSRTRTHWAVKYNSNVFICVYDSGKRNIATFLPKSTFERKYLRNLGEKTVERMKNNGMLDILVSNKQTE